MAGRCKTPDCTGYPRTGGICKTCAKLKRVEIVPNDPFRERYLELVQIEPEQDVNQGICQYMASKGYRSYVRLRDRRWQTADGVYLHRRLGMKSLCATRKRGRVYPGGWTKNLKYEEAVELSRALGMLPTEAGV